MQCRATGSVTSTTQPLVHQKDALKPTQRVSPWVPFSGVLVTPGQIQYVEGDQLRVQDRDGNAVYTLFLSPEGGELTARYAHDTSLLKANMRTLILYALGAPGSNRQSALDII
jgi:hypothetical protein